MPLMSRNGQFVVINAYWPVLTDNVLVINELKRYKLFKLRLRSLIVLFTILAKLCRENFRAPLTATRFSTNSR